jgi:hypothetical protein
MLNSNKNLILWALLALMSFLANPVMAQNCPTKPVVVNKAKRLAEAKNFFRDNGFLSSENGAWYDPSLALFLEKNPGFCPGVTPTCKTVAQCGIQAVNIEGDPAVGCGTAAAKTPKTVAPNPTPSAPVVATRALSLCGNAATEGEVQKMQELKKQDEEVIFIDGCYKIVKRSTPTETSRTQNTGGGEIDLTAGKGEGNKPDPCAEEIQKLNKELGTVKMGLANANNKLDALVVADTCSKVPVIAKPVDPFDASMEKKDTCSNPKWLVRADASGRYFRTPLGDVQGYSPTGSLELLKMIGANSYLGAEVGFDQPGYVFDYTGTSTKGTLPMVGNFSGVVKAVFGNDYKNNFSVGVGYSDFAGGSFRFQAGYAKEFSIGKAKFLSEAEGYSVGLFANGNKYFEVNIKTLFGVSDRTFLGLGTMGHLFRYGILPAGQDQPLMCAPLYVVFQRYMMSKKTCTNCYPAVVFAQFGVGGGELIDNNPGAPLYGELGIKINLTKPKPKKVEKKDAVSEVEKQRKAVTKPAYSAAKPAEVIDTRPEYVRKAEWAEVIAAATKADSIEKAQLATTKKVQATKEVTDSVSDSKSVGMLVKNEYTYPTFDRNPVQNTKAFYPVTAPTTNTANLSPPTVVKTVDMKTDESVGGATSNPKKLLFLDINKKHAFKGKPYPLCSSSSFEMVSDSVFKEKTPSMVILKIPSNASISWSGPKGTPGTTKKDDEVFFQLDFEKMSKVTNARLSFLLEENGEKCSGYVIYDILKESEYRAYQSQWGMTGKSGFFGNKDKGKQKK